MTNPPLAAIEFEAFLKDYGFRLVANVDDVTISYTVFANAELLLAFIHQQHDGENIAAACLGAPITTLAISSRSNGWQLVGVVLPDFWAAFHKERHALPYPHKLDRAHETALIDDALRRFMRAQKHAAQSQS